MTEMNHELAALIRALGRQGKGATAIARQLDLPRSTVRDVLNGRTWCPVPRRSVRGGVRGGAR